VAEKITDTRLKDQVAPRPAIRRFGTARSLVPAFEGERGLGGDLAPLYGVRNA